MTTNHPRCNNTRRCKAKGAIHCDRPRENRHRPDAGSRDRICRNRPGTPYQRKHNQDLLSEEWADRNHRTLCGWDREAVPLMRCSNSSNAGTKRKEVLFVDLSKPMVEYASGLRQSAGILSFHMRGMRAAIRELWK